MLTEIVNHLWQSTLVAAALAALAAMLRGDGAHARYWLWWAASGKFLVPFSLLSLLGSALGEAGVPRFEVADWPATIDVLAQPMPEIRTSQGLLEPALVGIARPVLLLPRGITEHLSHAQLEAVLEHELAHWRRRDNLTAARMPKESSTFASVTSRRRSSAPRASAAPI